MAISLIAKPQVITPAYNEVKYIYDSTNKNEDGFKYVFQVNDSGGNPVGAPFKLGSVEKLYCVLAIQTGRLPKPADSRS